MTITLKSKKKLKIFMQDIPLVTRSVTCIVKTELINTGRKPLVTIHDEINIELLLFKVNLLFSYKVVNLTFLSTTRCSKILSWIAFLRRHTYYKLLFTISTCDFQYKIKYWFYYPRKLHKQKEGASCLSIILLGHYAHIQIVMIFMSYNLSSN